MVCQFWHSLNGRPGKPEQPRKLIRLMRADDPGGTYRAVYVAQFGEAIYVLHAFQKKARSGIATAQRELDLIR
jgi:phage-related protein